MKLKTNTKTENVLKLEQTIDYKIFVSNEDQRAIDVRHAKKLAQSMQKVGFIPSKPIQCYWRNNKLVVVDGHHRLAAAEAAGVLVYYVVETEESQHMIAAENYLVKKWNTSDYIRTYANRGNVEYMRLIQYAEKSGLTLTTAASMLSNEQAASSNRGKSLIDGSWKIKSNSQLVAYIDLTQCVQRKEIRHPRFINAWSKCYFTPEFDCAIFVHKAKINQAMLTTCNNEDQALDMMEAIYNHKQSHKIPLAFLAKKSSASRQKAYGR